MKIYILLLFTIILQLYADAPAKVWTTANASLIETTETVLNNDTEDDTLLGQTFSEPLNYSEESEIVVSSSTERDLDDIPLAKLYPATHFSETPVEERKKEVGEPGVEENHEKRFAQKVEEVVSQIKKSTAKREEPVVKQYIPKANALHEKSAQDTIPASLPEDKEIYKPLSDEIDTSDLQTWISLFKEHKILSAILAGGLLLLALLLIKLLLKRERDGAVHRSPDELQEADLFSGMIETYSQLNGEVHKQFLKRKQNILFNDDFTQYQKAKALLELEKEYTQITYFDLPKLFSTDFDRFTQGHRALSSRPELREVVAEFVSLRLGKSNYTKAQREYIRKNMKNFYNSHQHTWQYEQKMDQKSEEEQKAYLLQ